MVGIPADLASENGGGGIAGALAVLAGLWGLLVLLLQAPIWAQYLEGGFLAGFDVAAIVRRVRVNVALTTVVAAMGIVLTVVALAGFALLVVGALVTIPCAAWAWAHVAGTYSRLTDRVVTAPQPEAVTPAGTP